MKQVFLFVAAILLIATAQAQVSISPLVTIAAKHASDQVTLMNNSLLPVVVTLDASTLGIVDGKVAVLPLSKDVTVKLHELSARIEPHSNHVFDYDLKCRHCVTVIVATVTPIEKKEKAVDDGGVHTSLKVNYAFATTVYVCEKTKGCRDSFKDIWSK